MNRWVLILALLKYFGRASCVLVPKVFPDPLWPQFRSYGQLSAVATDDLGNVYVFHRGDRVWDQDTFNRDNKFAVPSQGPISASTILVLDSRGYKLTSTGRNQFYIPHGLTVDHENNIWVTDVALHQVLKFPPLDLTKPSTGLNDPLLSLGEALIPGSDNYHFCKPTSVAIDSRSQDFFVADGYCNSRILKFNKKGRFLLKWGRPTTPYGHLTDYSLNVPHSLALDESRNHLIVADRENARLLCFNSLTGEFKHKMDPKANVYGVAYSPTTDKVFAVTWAASSRPGVGLVFSLPSDNITQVFTPQNYFKNVHDVAVSPNGRHVYAIELGPYNLWRFTVDNSTSPIESKERKKSDSGQERHNNGTVGPSFAQSEKKEATEPDSSVAVEAGYVAGLGANQVAVSVVTAVVLLSIFAVACHVYRKKAKTQIFEMRGLILDDDE